MFRIAVAAGALVAVLGSALVAASAQPVPVNPAVLTSGHTLSTGQRLVSPNGQYFAIDQAGGNLVVYSPTRAIFASHTAGAGVYVAMQSDGNLVIRNGAAKALWVSGTSGSGRSDASLTMQNDGNLVVRAAGRALWSSKTGRIPQPPQVAGVSIGSSMRAGSTLVVGQKLVAPGGWYVADVQGDGNFVVRGSAGAVYATRTAGSAARLSLQADGNLVLRAGNGRLLFTTRTHGTAAYGVLQTDGNFVIRGPNSVLWSSKSGLTEPGQVVHPGAFCAPAAAKGVTTTGLLMLCKTSAADSRNRWR
jgi:hypothetical protein